MLYRDFGLLIANRWLQAKSGDTLTVESPATEEVVGRIPSAGPDDAAAALESAARGFAVWRETPAWDRARIMRTAADLIRSRTEVIARIMSTETGKPLAEARVELGASADQFEWYAEEAKRIYGHTIPGRSNDQRLTVVYQPVGVCLVLTAWNFPALLPSRKIAAALAAGCSIIARPASEAPGSCFALGQALMDAGLPAGVLCILTGPPVPLVAQLIAAPEVRKVSLTGSVPVGKAVLAECAKGIKRASMELGGHAPVIVHRDADAVASARAAATAKFRNSGQVCISPSRFYVHEHLYETFIATFADVARSLIVGNGLDERVNLGPMIRSRAVQSALDLIADARARGARLVTGGRCPAHLNKGNYLEPTVLADVPDGALIMQEEPFAPVAPIASFTDDDEVIARANALPFGLAAYVFSNDAGRAQRTAERLEAGMVGINEMLLAAAEAPFGGVKESGFGREGGALGIMDYLDPKYVRHKLLRSSQ